jgi:hypothetical protein
MTCRSVGGFAMPRNVVPIHVVRIYLKQVSTKAPTPGFVPGGAPQLHVAQIV